MASLRDTLANLVEQYKASDTPLANLMRGDTEGAKKSAANAFEGMTKDPYAGLNASTTVGSKLAPMLLGHTVYHGSPYVFEKFLADKIGSGVGQTLRGKGIYFSESPQIAEDYAKRLGIEKTSMSQLASDYLKQDVPPSAIRMLHDVATSSTPIEEAARKVQGGSIALRNESPETLKNIVSNFRENLKGMVYKSDIPDKDIPKMLDWSKPLNEQTSHIQQSWEQLVPKILENNPRINNFPGDNAAKALQNSLINKNEGTLGDLYPALEGALGNDPTLILKQHGIKGIKYPSAEENLPKVNNFVVFDPSEVKILERTNKLADLLKQ